MRKILISSYSFAKDHGSESELGWRSVEGLVGHYEIVVFVSITYRKLFDEEKLEELAKKGVVLEFVGFKGLVGRVLRIPKLARIHYIFWQKRLPRWVSERYEPDDFDLVHHVSWASFSSPSRLWKLGRPFLVGPVGGGEVSPLKLLSGLPHMSKVYEVCRMMRIFSKKWDRSLRQTIREADVFWVSNPDTAERCRVHANSDNLRVRTQVFVPDKLPELSPSRSGFVVITVARLVPLKRVDILVRSFLEAEGVEGELRVVGDGPEIETLRALALERSNEKRKVTFCGWLSREEVAHELQQAKIFAFTSLHDSASFAVLEAMSHGLAVVTFGCGGPAYLSREGAGLVVEGEDVCEVVAGFRDAFQKLYTQPELITSLGKRARERAEGLTREKSHKEVLEVYSEVLGKYK